MDFTLRHQESRCPQCNYKLDASTLMAGGKPGNPVAGDISVCLNCGQVLKYEDAFVLRKITGQELGELMTEQPHEWAVIEKAQQFIRQRGQFFRENFA